MHVHHVESRSMAFTSNNGLSVTLPLCSDPHKLLLQVVCSGSVLVHKQPHWSVETDRCQRLHLTPVHIYRREGEGKEKI